MLDERTRHEMYLGLEEKLGTAVADAVMQHLPPVGWADVATKHDLAALEERLDLRFAVVDVRFDAFERRVDERFDALEGRLGAFERRVDERFDGLESRLDLRIQAEINRLLYFLIPTVFTAIGLAFAVSKIG